VVRGREGGEAPFKLHLGKGGVERGAMPPYLT